VYGGSQELWEDYVFLGTLTLIYDNDGKQVSEDVLFTTLYGPELGYFYKPGKNRVLREGLNESEAARLTSQNEQRIEEIKQKKAPKSGNVQALIEIIG
jgi:hypothetical protein